MARKVLYLTHYPDQAHDRVVDLLGAETVEICDHSRGDPLPADAAQLAGVVVGGGPHSVSQTGEQPYLARQIDWVREVVGAGVPMVGICLGAQILAHAFGGRVDRRADGRCEIGYHRIAPTAAGAAIFGDLRHVLQYHCEGFELPAGGELLAGGEVFQNQAFRYGADAYGFQFHPDCRPDMLAAFADDAGPRMDRPGAQPLVEQQRLAPIHDPPFQRWFAGFLDHWLSRPA